MADSFFGFDTSISNLNDDEGGGEPSEDEYDALNDETFGHGSDELDWEMEHEHLAEQLESSRRHNYSLDETGSQLEASLSQLVLDETDAPQSRILGSSVWRNDLPFPAAPTPVPALKNVCTVEEIERQLRQKQMQSQHQNQPYSAQNYYQPRFPPVILQRPPGLQAPVPLPFAPQQSMAHNLNQMGQPLNKLMNQSNQMGQTNQLMSNHVGQGLNQLGQNQLGQNLSQFMQNTNQFQNNQGNMMNMSQMQNVHMNQPNLLQNQLGQNVSQNMTMNQMGQNQMSQNMMQLGQNTNQIGQNINQNMSLNQNVSMNQNMSKMGQNINPLGQSMGPIGQNVPQINQNVPHLSQNMPPISQTMPPMSQNQIGQNMNQMGQSMNQMGQNMNQMAPNVNQMGQNVNQMGQNVNQMMPNGNQFGQMNQFSPHSMGQPRMMAPPPGINMPRQNFSPGIGQFNPNFRGPSIKPEQQQNMLMNQQLMKPMQKINQINQSPQNKTVTAKKVDNKPKTRVYNNSNNKNLTSQNLVQIIQNTHPILQFNNSYHNANHHPMLNRNMYSQVGLPMMNAQRQNGTYHNNSSLNGDDMGSDCDEYAGLMTQREKQWLINIQMLQLNTGTPYIHDFYYTVFLERQARKEKEGVKEAHKANQQNHPFYSGAVMQEGVPHRERHNSNRHNSTSEDGGTPRAYVPAQFENSLGKLQCGSVTAPRKIIDVEVVAADAAAERAPSRASVTTAAEAPREVKRTKQLLLDIEALYLILLRLEELNDPLAITNALILKEREEKHKQMEAAQKELENEDDDSNLFLKNIESVQRRPKQDSPKSESIDKRQVVNLAVSQKQAPVKNLLDEDKDDLVNKMYAGLLHGDRLQQMLTVRKGRALLVRFLRRAGVPTAGAACGGVRALWSRVLRALPSAARRDAAGLHALAHHYRTYIQATNGWSAIQESCAILAETLDPARTPYVLTTAFTLSAVCALVEKAAALVNTPEPSSGERQWYKFLKTLARALKHTSLPVARPGQPLPEAKLVHHIRQLESRSTVEILQRGKSAELELSKAEISEQLVKYLC